MGKKEMGKKKLNREKEMGKKKWKRKKEWTKQISCSSNNGYF